MTDQEQIIIDDVDILKEKINMCFILLRNKLETPETIEQTIYEHLDAFVKEWNNELVHKTQENEELKESNKKAQELYKYFMNVAENTANKNKELENNLHIANTNHEAAEKECDCYLGALEEIEEIVSSTLDCGEWVGQGDNKMAKILDIISRAKDC